MSLDALDHGAVVSKRDLRRHWLVDITPQAWAAMLTSRPDLASEPLLESWADRGWPTVVRRRFDGDAAGCVPLGLPLPPMHGKKRIALAFAPDAISSIRRPIALSDIHRVVPPSWQPTYAALLDLGRDHRIRPRVFGSFAWAALTGLPYMTATSDLDLVWPLTADTPALLECLQAIEATAPGRIDGEIEGNGWVNWRELVGAPTEVMVKSIDAVHLKPTADFLRSPADPADEEDD